ncbi:MAG: hypothetical protein ACKVOM_00975 [Ferruginibacter sp.]
MDKLILRFVLFFAKTFLKKDVDFEKLKIITETKLIMDRRRARVTMKQKVQKDPKNQLLISQIVYAIFGIFVGAIFFTVKEIIPCMVILHTYILFMMAMTLITDFSTVLLDTTDNQIILPRPVSSKTFFMSRLVHILVYLLQFTIALSIFPLIFTFVLFGALVGIAAIFTILFTVVFAVFLTYLLYGLILRFSNEEKIKDIVSWSQIVMTIVFAGGMQILPRIIDVSNLQIKIDIHWYSYFIPAMWMAYTLEAVYALKLDSPHILMIVLSVLVPAITFWIMIKFLAPSFSRKIGALGNSDTQPLVAIVKNTGQEKSFLQKILPVLCKNKTEEAGFELTYNMTARDKSFKIQFYPSLAYLLVFAFIFVFNRGKDVAQVWAALNTTESFLWFAYLPMFTISTGIALIAFNENFAASWLYLASPLKQPGSLISGALKALLFKFFVPIFLLLYAFSFYIWGYIIIDDFVLAFFNNTVIFLLISHIGKSHLPFSMQPNVQQQTGKFIQVILQILMIALLVGLHYLALKLTWLVAVLIPVSVMGCYFLLRTIQQYTWQKITN